MNFIFKMFGWLFSNLILILVVISMCYAYVYWDDPFGAETPAGQFTTKFSHEIKQVKSFVAGFGLPGLTDDAATGDGSASSDSVASMSADKVQTADNVAVEPITSSAAPADSAVTRQKASEPAEQQEASSENVFVTPEIEDALGHLQNDGSIEDVTAMQQVDKPADQLMIDARNAFYKRDYEACIDAYKQLLIKEKDNFDALGEMGNVYFTQGKMQDAADAYYQAATIMVSQGKTKRAASLIDFLASIDADKAKKLGEMLVSDDQDQNAL